MVKGTVTISIEDYNRLVTLEDATMKNYIACRTTKGDVLRFYTESEAIENIADINTDLEVKLNDFDYRLSLLVDQYNTDKRAMKNNLFYALRRNFSFWWHGCPA